MRASCESHLDLISGLYVIDTKGVLRSMIVNDLPVGRSVSETLRLVKAFQFADEHGASSTSDYVTLSLTCLM